MGSAARWRGRTRCGTFPLTARLHPAPRRAPPLGGTKRKCQLLAALCPAEPLRTPSMCPRYRHLENGNIILSSAFQTNSMLPQLPPTPPLSPNFGAQPRLTVHPTHTAHPPVHRASSSHFAVSPCAFPQRAFARCTRYLFWGPTRDAVRRRLKSVAGARRGLPRHPACDCSPSRGGPVRAPRVTRAAARQVVAAACGAASHSCNCSPSRGGPVQRRESSAHLFAKSWPPRATTRVTRATARQVVAVCA